MMRGLLRHVAVGLVLSSCLEQPSLGEGKLRTIYPAWETLGAGARGPIENRLAVGSTVIAFDTTGQVMGVEAATGVVRWRKQIPFKVPPGGPVRVNDSTFALATGDGAVTIVATSGAVLAQSANYGATTSGENVSPSESVLLSNGTVVFSDTTQSILSYEPTSGRVESIVRLPTVAKRDVRRPYVASFAQVEDTLFVIRVMVDDEAQAYRTYTVYRVLLTSNRLDSLPAQRTHRMQPGIWLEAREDWLFFASMEYESGWALIDRSTGQVRRWATGTNGFSGHFGQRVVLGDTLFAAARDGGVYAIQMSSGQILRRGSFLHEAGSSGEGVAVCADIVYVSTVSGGVVVFDRRTMRLIGRGVSRNMPEFVDRLGDLSSWAQVGDLAIVQADRSMLAFPCPVSSSGAS
jgi:hypothetical protein